MARLMSTTTTGPRVCPLGISIHHLRDEWEHSAANYIDIPRVLMSRRDETELNGGDYDCDDYDDDGQNDGQGHDQDDNKQIA